MPRSTCVDVLLKDEKLSYKSKNRHVPVFAYVLIMFVEIIFVSLMHVYACQQIGDNETASTNKNEIFGIAVVSCGLQGYGNRGVVIPTQSILFSPLL